MLLLSGHAPTVQQAVALFDHTASEAKETKETKGAAVPPDLRSSVYVAVAKEKGREGWLQLRALYTATDSAEEAARLLSALGRSKDEQTLKEALTWALDSGEVRDQDVPTLVASLCRSKVGRDLVWSHVQSNWAALNKRFGNGAHLLISILHSVVVGYETEEMAVKFEDFFAKNPCKVAERSLKQAVEKIRSKAARLARETPMLEEWARMHSAERVANA